MLDNTTMTASASKNTKASAFQLVQKLLEAQSKVPQKPIGQAFAPSNIALCKYWGKRDETLNLPLTNSLSISLGDYGAKTSISEINAKEDYIIVNQQALNHSSTSSTEVSSEVSSHNFMDLKHQQDFCKRLIAFLDLFRPSPSTRYKVETELNIPIAAGLASSACGFAALVKALADLYQWKLKNHELSILARLGSGSACRSLWDGFVEWERGQREDGMDSYGVYIKEQMPNLRIGLLIVNENQKPISSRLAMKNTKKSSLFFAQWPEKVKEDLAGIKLAIQTQDFTLLGTHAESNAIAMHALMMTANPPILYITPETIQGMQQVWRLRAEGVPVYFTQDAGPNLKLLFLEQDRTAIMEQFQSLQWIDPFAVKR